jgi:hypothetical protein
MCFATNLSINAFALHFYSLHHGPFHDLNVLRSHRQHRRVDVEVRADELTVTSPHIVAVRQSVVAGVLTLEVLRPVHHVDVVERRVEDGDVGQVQEGEEAGPVDHGAQLCQAVGITETKLVHGAPVPLKALLAGGAEHVQRNLIPSGLEAVRGVHVTTEKGAARTHHERAVGSREAHSRAGAAQHGGRQSGGFSLRGKRR